MADIGTVIEQLKGAIADAKTAAAALQGAGSAAEDHLAAVRRNLGDLESIEQRAEDEKKRLDARDGRNVARAQGYAAAIAAVFKDFAAGGSFTSGSQTELKTLVKDALGLGSLADLDELRDAVDEYDKATRKLIDDAQQALDASAGVLAQKRTDLDTARKELDGAEGALDKHARNALDVHAAALADKEAVEAAVNDSGQFRAVVRLHDFITRRDRLKDAVKLDAQDPRFDADDAAGAATALEAKWGEARDAYRDALVTAIESEIDVVRKRIDLADARAGAQIRTASRLTDAADDVQQKLAGAGGESGTGGETETGGG